MDDRQILEARPAKNDVNPFVPYAFLLEHERSRFGTVDPVATIFLTNRECPFRCLMCDLWKNTTDDRVPAGAIAAQIDYALERLPTARHLKLYNSGNFFDHQAIPADDHDAIAARARRFETVIIENHPKLLRSEEVLSFRDQLVGRLEIAIGLETVHPDVLPRLNKRMSLDDVRRAATCLQQLDVDRRAFILLRPPFMGEAAGIEWALRSFEFAWEAGFQTCALIPTRAGNGIMDQLQAAGLFTPPSLSSLEATIDEALSRARGRVMADLWDLERLEHCDHCIVQRRERLQRINDSQQAQPTVPCAYCG